MNYYHCYWFSEVNDVQHEVDILIAHTDTNAARMIANRYITNISHFDLYPINIVEFGSPRFIINHEWASVEIISSLLTIKEAFKLLSDIGMDITAVDSLAHPLKDNLQHIIRWMLRKEFGISNDDPFTSAMETDDPVDGNLTPTQIIKITELITHILQDAKELYVKTKWIIGWDNFVLFTRNIEQLQQTLAQWDINNAKEQTKRLISLMEQVEWEYIEYEKARDHQVQNQITIPNLNTILAHNQWIKANKMYELQSSENHKVEQWYETIYHTLFRRRVLYFKWVWSELALIVWWHGNLLSYFIRKFEYMLIFMSCIVLIIIESGGHMRYWGNTLYVIGLAWFALQCSHLIHTKHRYLKASFLLWWIIFTWVIGYIIASNLALI